MKKDTASISEDTTLPAILRCPVCQTDITQFVNSETARRAGKGLMAKHGKEHMQAMSIAGNKKRWDAVRAKTANKPE